MTYAFTTIDDSNDPTFNQLLGIDNAGEIAGYFGSAMPAGTHPNQGYTIRAPYTQAAHTDENATGSTQLTAQSFI